MLRRIFLAPDRTPYDAPLRWLWPALLVAGTLGVVAFR
jgi:hypothetical protein